MLTFSLGYGPVGRRTYLDGELTMALRQILGFQGVTHAGSVSGRQRTTGGVRARGSDEGEIGGCGASSGPPLSRSLGSVRDLRIP